MLESTLMAFKPRNARLKWVGARKTSGHCRIYIPVLSVLSALLIGFSVVRNVDVEGVSVVTVESVAEDDAMREDAEVGCCLLEATRSIKLLISLVVVE